MKINQNPTPNSNALEQTKATDRAGTQKALNAEFKKNSVEAQDQANVEISDAARMMQKAREIALNAPDYRADKVASLKKAILSGNYRVDTESLAEKILDDHLGTDLGKNNL